MPDKEGKLTDNDKVKIREWMSNRWTAGPNCIVCGEKNWTVAEHMVTPLRIGDEGGVRLGGNTYPNIMIVCMNCAYVLAFNAPLMGVVENKANRTEEPEETDAA